LGKREEHFQMARPLIKQAAWPSSSFSKAVRSYNCDWGGTTLPLVRTGKGIKSPQIHLNQSGNSRGADKSSLERCQTYTVRMFKVHYRGRNNISFYSSTVKYLGSTAILRRLTCVNSNEKCRPTAILAFDVSTPNTQLDISPRTVRVPCIVTWRKKLQATRGCVNFQEQVDDVFFFCFGIFALPVPTCSIFPTRFGPIFRWRNTRNQPKRMWRV
jgi:hypothetical protein